MFTQPITSPPGPTATSPVSPSRPSRLRGLSYLRNYTHNHLLSRDSSHSSNNSAATSPSSSHPPSNVLTRSISYTPTSNNNNHSSNTEPSGLGNNNSSSTGHRLTLTSSTPTQPQATVSQREAATTARPNPGPTVESGDDAREDPSSSDNVNSVSTPASSTNPQPAVDEQSDHQSDQQPDMTRTRAADAPAAAAAHSADNVPSIRFSAYYDPRSTRPSLSFSPITRNLPTGSEVIRVGRYSERDSQLTSNTPGNQPSAAPVGFKSKVVSRRHCEFWHEDGKWYIRDVKSSSGTFLNHIRLSPPSQESKAFPVNDGDIVQLGIDFKGGEEMIFRCVKMRLELNRGWQNKPNTFNMAAHKRLRTMANNGAAASGTNSQDCSICLNSIAPCQSLFVAPCSHTWHFKCVRSLLTSPQYPIFICPNCRAGADLEADVDEPSEEWQQLEEEGESDEKPATDDEHPSPAVISVSTPPEAEDSSVHDGDVMEVTVHITPSDSPIGASTLPIPSAPVPIHHPASGSGRVGPPRDSRTPSPPVPGAEGPITPRNDAGPWVFDGSAGGGSAPEATSEMHSLNAAADMNTGRAVVGDATT